MSGITSDLRAEFAQNFTHRREAIGLSQTALASLLHEHGLDNFYPTTVSRIEAGLRSVHIEEAVVIARILGCTVSDLISLDGKPDIPVDTIASACAKAEYYVRLIASLTKEPTQ